MGWVVNATPRPLFPRERPDTHFIGGWVSLQVRSVRLWKISSPPGFDPWAFQSVASRYTEYALPAPV